MAKTRYLAVEEVTRLDELENLRGEWSALCDRSSRCTPFQRPEWILPWCRHLGLEKLWVLAVRQAGRLVGLAPFALDTARDEKTASGSPRRVVVLLGSDVSDYHDAVFEPRFAGPAGAAILAHLDATDGWDLCEFSSLHPSSELLAVETPEGWSEERTAQQPSPALALPDRVEALSRVVPARQLKNLAQFRRRLARQGMVRWTTADHESCAEHIAELIRLHGLRWRQRSRPGALHLPAIQAFHREVVAGFARRRTLALHLLHLDDRVIAAYYGFVEKSQAYFYLHGFDPEWAKWSPGFLVVGFAIEDAVHCGLDTFDFLRGAEAYKYRWGARDVSRLRRRLWRSAARRAERQFPGESCVKDIVV